jgi:hypothetical protein
LKLYFVSLKIIIIKLDNQFKIKKNKNKTRTTTTTKMNDNKKSDNSFCAPLQHHLLYDISESFQINKEEGVEKDNARLENSNIIRNSLRKNSDIGYNCVSNYYLKKRLFKSKSETICYICCHCCCNCCSCDNVETMNDSNTETIFEMSLADEVTVNNILIINNNNFHNDKKTVND